MNSKAEEYLKDYLIALLKVAKEEKAEIDTIQVNRIFFLLEKEKGVNLNLDFKPELFGPYSEKLNEILYELIKGGVVRVTNREANHVSFKDLVVGLTHPLELNGDYEVKVDKDILDFFRQFVVKDTKDMLKYFYSKYRDFIELSKIKGMSLQINEKSISLNIRDAIVDLEIAKIIKNNITSKEKENRMLFCLASSAEKFTKALSPIYALTIIYPLFLFVSSGDWISESDLVKEEIDESKSVKKCFDLYNTILLASFDENKLKVTKHRPISNSELKELIECVEKFLPRELKDVYDKMIKYIRKKQNKRRYKDIESFMKEINNTVDSFNFENELKKGLLVGMYNTNQELLKDIAKNYISALRKVSEAILYMLYLEHAAGSVARYSVGRNEKDKKYLEDLRQYEDQIFKFLEDKKESLEKSKTIFDLKIS